MPGQLGAGHIWSPTYKWSREGGRSLSGGLPAGFLQLSSSGQVAWPFWAVQNLPCPEASPRRPRALNFHSTSCPQAPE